MNFTSLTAIFIILATVYSRKLPSFINKCKWSDPNLGKCISDNIGILKDKFQVAIPEIGLPMIEPLFIPKAELKSSDPNGLKASFSDIRVHNPTSFVLKKLDVNEKRDMISVHVFIPYLYIDGQYQLNGRILILQLNGHGQGEANITNLDCTIDYKLSKYQKKGKDFLKLERSKDNISYRVTKLWFKNLFAGRDELTTSTNQVINENIDEVMKEFKPIVDNTARTVIDGVVFRVFDRFSFNDLFDT